MEEEEECKGRVVYRSEGEGDRENMIRDDIRERGGVKKRREEGGMKEGQGRVLNITIVHTL